MRRSSVAVAALLGSLSVLIAADPTGASETRSPAVSLGASRTVILVDEAFICEDHPQPLQLDLVRVTATESYPGEQGHAAVNLGNRGGGARRDCSGRIGRLEVDSVIGDGIKIGAGAHDLVIESAKVHLRAKRALGIHQDGVQAMGGKGIKIRNAEIWVEMGHAVYVNGPEGPPEGWPHDVVFENCTLRGSDGSAWTATVKNSVRSGFRNCVFVAGTEKLHRAMPIGDGAVGPISDGNRVVPPGVAAAEIPEWMRPSGAPGSPAPIVPGKPTEPAPSPTASPPQPAPPPAPGTPPATAPGAPASPPSGPGVSPPKVTNTPATKPPSKPSAPAAPSPPTKTEGSSTGPLRVRSFATIAVPTSKGTQLVAYMTFLAPKGEQQHITCRAATGRRVLRVAKRTESSYHVRCDWLLAKRAASRRVRGHIAVRVGDRTIKRKFTRRLHR